MKRGRGLPAIVIWAACFPAWTSAAAAGPDTHLAEARTEGGATVVFVPSSEIGAPDEAAAFLGWAEASHPDRAVRAVWDTDEAVVVLAEPALRAALRVGDEAVDPSGRVRFTVAGTPETRAGAVSLRLASLPGAGEATPELCLTNVWILPREALFARLTAALRGGAAEDVASVRAAFAALGRAGRFADDPWRSEAKEFLEKTPAARAAVRFRNAGTAAVRLRIEGGAPQRLDPGETWDWRPSVSTAATNVRWTARSLAPDALPDDEWEWRGGAADWDPFGPDVVLPPFEGTVGRPKPEPVFLFPENAIPDSLPDDALAATVRYADGEERTAALVRRGGRRAVAVEPRRTVAECTVEAAGWRRAVFRPEETRWFLRRGEEARFAGGAMRKELPPWPALRFRVDRNGAPAEEELAVEVTVDDRKKTLAVPSGGDVVEWCADPRLAESEIETAKLVAVLLAEGRDRKNMPDAIISLRRGDPATNLSFRVPAPPKPWPSDEEVDEAKKWFEEALAPYFGEEPHRKNDPIYKSNRRKQEAELLRLCGFRPEPNPPPEKAWAKYESVVDRMAAHIDGCPECAKHGRWSVPRSEALLVLGWRREDQKRFWNWPESLRKGGVLRTWWSTYCEKVLKGDYESPGNLHKIRDVWNGADEQPLFAKAFVHVRLCPGCGDCGPYRAAVKNAAPDFEAMRDAFFREVMLRRAGEAFWGNYQRPTEEKVETILRKLNAKNEGGR